MVNNKAQHYLLTRDIEKRFANHDDRANVKKSLDSFSAYREEINPFEMDDKFDKSWLGAFKKSERDTVNLYREIIFGYTYDATLRLAMRLNKSAQESMASGEIGQEFEKLEKTAAKSA